jgi:hypothetical protein
MNVFSDRLVWRPMGQQAERLAEAPPRVVHADILLAKLKPGQRIKVEGWCRKGVGKDHAKFSPVCTASYRLLPRIDIVEVGEGEGKKGVVLVCVRCWGGGGEGVGMAAWLPGCSSLFGQPTLLGK